MYPKPVSVAVHSYGWLYFLCNYDETRGKSDLIKTRMHSPLDKCLGVKKQVIAKEVPFSAGIVSLCADDSKITIVDEEGKVDLNVRKNKSQVTAKEKFEALGLALQTSVVTVAQMKESLIPHKNSVRKQYTERVFERTTIKFGVPIVAINRNFRLFALLTTSYCMQQVLQKTPLLPLKLR